MNYYRNPDESPGNFRQPTIEKCQAHIKFWADQGVNKISDFNSFALTKEEKDLEKIRWKEAKHYLDRYQKQVGLHGGDSYVYRKPIFSTPFPDSEDYGDFHPVDKSTSRRYLYNFFKRQTERVGSGQEMQDTEIYPWKPRYDEASYIYGADEADVLEDEVFDRAGLAVTRRNPSYPCVCNRRRNPRDPDDFFSGKNMRSEWQKLMDEGVPPTYAVMRMQEIFGMKWTHIRRKLGKKFGTLPFNRKNPYRRNFHMGSSMGWCPHCKRSQMGSWPSGIASGIEGEFDPELKCDWASTGKCDVTGLGGSLPGDEGLDRYGYPLQRNPHYDGWAAPTFPSLEKRQHLRRRGKEKRRRVQTAKSRRKAQTMLKRLQGSRAGSRAKKSLTPHQKDLLKEARDFFKPPGRRYRRNSWDY